MIDTPNEPQEEFNPTREHEYQGAHYHDDDAEITDDERIRRANKLPAGPKKTPHRPPPQRRHYED